MFDPAICIRSGAYLPHWTKEGANYHVRLRLCDSVPQSKLREWKEEREELVQKSQIAKQSLNKVEKQRLDELFSEKIERFLDAGYGECWLKRDDVAEVVADTLWKFHGDRYELHAWCIMPNHLHVVLQQLTEELSKIVYSWKWYTAKHANGILKRSGSFWQREYFDHLLRDREATERAINYGPLVV